MSSITIIMSYIIIMHVPAIPTHLDKHEYVFRAKSSGDRSIGCHFLNRLNEKNSECFFKVYSGLIVLKGRGEYLDWNGRRFPLKPGSFAQHLPGKYHVLRRDLNEEWLETSITLGPVYYQSLVNLGSIDPDRGVIEISLANDLISDFERLHVSLKNCSEQALNERLLDIHSLLFKILNKEKCNLSHSQPSTAVSKAIDELSRNFHKKIDLRQLAGKINMSYSHFRREFKNATGVTPGIFRIRRRVEQAKLMIGSGEENVQSTAEALGYPDPFTFSKQFKKITGISPKNWKKSFGK